MNRWALSHLIDLGRVEDALAVLRRRTPRQPELSDGPWQGHPPFRPNHPDA